MDDLKFNLKHYFSLLSQSNVDYQQYVKAIQHEEELIDKNFRDIYRYFITVRDIQLMQQDIFGTLSKMETEIKSQPFYKALHHYLQYTNSDAYKFNAMAALSKYNEIEAIACPWEEKKRDGSHICETMMNPNPNRVFLGPYNFDGKVNYKELADIWERKYTNVYPEEYFKYNIHTLDYQYYDFVQSRIEHIKQQWTGCFNKEKEPIENRNDFLKKNDLFCAYFLVEMKPYFHPKPDKKVNTLLLNKKHKVNTLLLNKKHCKKYLLYLFRKFDELPPKTAEEIFNMCESERFLYEWKRWFDLYFDNKSIEVEENPGAINIFAQNALISNFYGTKLISTNKYWFYKWAEKIPLNFQQYELKIQNGRASLVIHKDCFTNEKEGDFNYQVFSQLPNAFRKIGLIELNGYITFSVNIIDGDTENDIVQRLLYQLYLYLQYAIPINLQYENKGYSTVYSPKTDIHFEVKDVDYSFVFTNHDENERLLLEERWGKLQYLIGKDDANLQILRGHPQNLYYKFLLTNQKEQNRYYWGLYNNEFWKFEHCGVNEFGTTTYYKYRLHFGYYCEVELGNGLTLEVYKSISLQLYEKNQINDILNLPQPEQLKKKSFCVELYFDCYVEAENYDCALAKLANFTSLFSIREFEVLPKEIQDLIAAIKGKNGHRTHKFNLFLK